MKKPDLRGLRKFIITIMALLIGMIAGIMKIIESETFVWYFAVVMTAGAGSNVLASKFGGNKDEN